MQRNPYVAPNATLRTEKEPDRVHVIANLVMLSAFAAFALGGVLLVVVAVVVFPSFRDAIAPTALALTITAALGAWSAANVVGMLRRRPWAWLSSRVFWIASCLGVCTIPFACYGFSSVGLPHVRRVFVRNGSSE